MKCGKSQQLISDFAPWRYTRQQVGLFQPERNVRDEGIRSRIGTVAPDARKVSSIWEIVEQPLDRIGIDEIHMFQPGDVDAVAALLEKGATVVACGLDMDYKRDHYEIVLRLLKLADDVSLRRAVCHGCSRYTARYTQVYSRGVAVTGGLPSVIPEDGTYAYEPVCRSCFVSRENRPPAETRLRSGNLPIPGMSELG